MAIDHGSEWQCYSSNKGGSGVVALCPRNSRDHPAKGERQALSVGSPCCTVLDSKYLLPCSSSPTSSPLGPWTMSVCLQFKGTPGSAHWPRAMHSRNAGLGGFCSRLCLRLLPPIANPNELPAPGRRSQGRQKREANASGKDVCDVIKQKKSRRLCPRRIPTATAFNNSASVGSRKPALVP